MNMRVKANTWLNVRAGRGLTYAKVGQFTPGQIIDVTGIVDGWATVMMFPPSVALYVSAQYIEPIPVDDEPPAPTYPRNRLGWHILPGAPRSFLNMLGRLHTARRPVPMVVLPYITDGRKVFTPAEIKAVSPSTIVVVRIFTGVDYHAEDKGGWNNTTRQDGRDYYNANKVLITPEIRRADYVIIRDLNETGIGRGYNAWVNGILDGANDDGEVKLLTLTFSVGNPGIPGESRDDAWYWSNGETHQLLQRIIRENHGVAVHQYFRSNATDPHGNSWLSDTSWAWRHEQFYPHLPADIRNNLKLWITEFGQSKEVRGTLPDRSPALYERIFRYTQDRLAASAGDPDVAFWTLGDSGGWQPDRLEQVLETYEQIAMKR